MKSLQNYVLGFALTLGVTGGATHVNAQSYTADFQGTNYDFTYVNGTYNDLQTTLQNNFFWGASNTAKDYVTEVGDVLGYNAIQNSDIPPYGPFFAYSESSGLLNVRAYNTDFGNVFTQSIGSADFDTEYTFAVATQSTTTSAPTPVPEINGSTIPLLAFIMGTIALGLRKRQSLTAKADNHLCHFGHA